jgi:hypothetical protein
MFLMVVGGTCSVALCVQVLQCCLLRFCDKEEKISVLQIRAVENPIAGTAGIAGTTVKVETIEIGEVIDEDPKIQE